MARVACRPMRRTNYSSVSSVKTYHEPWCYYQLAKLYAAKEISCLFLDCNLYIFYILLQRYYGALLITAIYRRNEPRLSASTTWWKQFLFFLHFFIFLFSVNFQKICFMPRWKLGYSTPRGQTTKPKEGVKGGREVWGWWRPPAPPFAGAVPLSPRLFAGQAWSDMTQNEGPQKEEPARQRHKRISARRGHRMGQAPESTWFIPSGGLLIFSSTQNHFASQGKGEEIDFSITINQRQRVFTARSQ